MEDPLGRGTLHGLSCAEPRLPRVVQCSTRERTRVSHGRDESPGPPTSFLSALIRVVQGDAQTLRPSRRNAHARSSRAGIRTHLPTKEVVMSTTVHTATDVRPVQRRRSRREARRVAPPHQRDAVASRGARQRSVARSSVGDDAGAHALLGHPVRLAQVRGRAERPAAVQDQDRRARHPLHPRQVAARERVAADPHARVARLGDRDAGVVGPLTDPTAYGGRAEDAFDLVLPSLPGFGFSGQPTELGWDQNRTAKAWAELMSRLGYTRYVAQGGDQGRVRHRCDGAAGPRWPGRHSPQLPQLLPARRAGRRSSAPAPCTDSASALRWPSSPPMPRRRSPRLSQALGAVFKRGYIVEMPEHPQTIGFALTDSPVGLAAWMLDHDADSYRKISRAFVDGNPTGGLTRDRVLDNITLTWLTGTGASSARIYWEEEKHTCRDCGRAEAPEAHAPRGLHRLPQRALPGAAQVGREGLSQPDLLQRGRQGRPLRRLGRAGDLLSELREGFRSLR